VYKTRVALGLPALEPGDDHPGRQALERKIRKLYVLKGLSVIQIGKRVRMNDENVRKILKKHGVEMRVAHVTDPLYFPIKNSGPGRTDCQLRDKIKTLFYDGVTIAQIGKQLGVDQGTVSTKLRAMGVDTEPLNNHKKLDGGYPCLWCGVVMGKVWQNRGVRRQKYCGSPCSCRAKDYRKIIRGQKCKRPKLVAELKRIHGEDYQRVHNEIMNVEACIK